MGLGQVSDYCAQGFNKFVAGGLKRIRKSACSLPLIGRVSDFVQRYVGFYVEQMGENPGNFFIRPVILLNAAVKHFDLAGVPKGLKSFLSRSLVTKSHLQSISIFTQLPKMIEALSTKIENTLDLEVGTDYARELVIAKESRINPGRGEEGEERGETWEIINRIDRTEEFTLGEKLGRKMVTVASWLMGCGDTFNEWKECQKVSPLLARIVPWVQTASGLYMGTQGLFEEGQIYYRNIHSIDSGESVGWVEKRYSLMSMAVSASYIACGVCGGLKTWFADQASKNLKGCHFAFVAATVVLPIIQAYCKREVEELHVKVEEEEEERSRVDNRAS